MNLDYGVRTLADSISPLGIRLVTFEVTFPRFILAEFNTHRILSRNSASSRAIPPEKQIERLLTAPFVPQFGTRVKGMGSGVLNENQLECVEIWLEARDAAVAAARRLVALDVDKARVNRLLEPFMWHTVIASGTNWSNFFALRTHKDAQPEFKIIADMMLHEYRTSEPEQLAVGDWHLPLIYPEDREAAEFSSVAAPLPSASAGRCARVSFDTHALDEHLMDSISRYSRLITGGHWSPTEHQAQVAPENLTDNYKSGNFHGDWAQFRKMHAFEEDFSQLLRITEATL